MSKGATIHLTKLAAAERQLNAAIRLFLAGEDDLAIHTIGAAAYGILRDLKKRRGRSELADIIARGVFYIARDLTDGKLSAMPPDIRGTGLEDVVHSVCEGIKSGRISGREDVPIQVGLGSETSYWNRFRLPSNFLKHADRDPSGMLELSTVSNETLLMAAAGAHFDVAGRTTPEVIAFSIYREGDFRAVLNNLTQHERRTFVYEYLEELREKQVAD